MKNKDYYMYSDEGNLKVQTMLSLIELDKEELLTKNETYICEFLEKECQEICDQGYGEVFDTDVREIITSEVEKILGVELSIYW